jgi:hypothetical protein
MEHIPVITSHIMGHADRKTNNTHTVRTVPKPHRKTNNTHTVGFWNSTDSVPLFFFLLYFGTVLTG